MFWLFAVSCKARNTLSVYRFFVSITYIIRATPLKSTPTSFAYRFTERVCDYQGVLSSSWTCIQMLPVHCSLIESVKHMKILLRSYCSSYYY